MSENRRHLLLTFQPRNQITVMQSHVCRALLCGVCVVQRVRHFIDRKIAEQISESE